MSEIQDQPSPDAPSFEPGQLSESAEEALARLWVKREEGVEGPVLLEDLDAGDPPALTELLEAGFVELASDRVSLTPAGEKEAASIVRRERLAERLLTDVLDMAEPQVTEAACRFEHLLQRGIDDEICTLLGHPKVCPHGHPIPPGDCCRAGTRSLGTVISSLADLSPGQAGVVAYLHGARRLMVQRLLAMGVIPGAPILLQQKTPSYVFQLGNAQIAVDRETAQDVYVRVTANRHPPNPPPSWLRKPFRGFRFRGGRR
jgi:DtxR family Mn-dependent transcriptional regulator